MNELQNDLRGREVIYRILGRIYRTEADEKLMEQLAGFAFPADTGNESFTEGAGELKRFIENGNFDYDEIAADYAHTFLAAGIPRGQVAFPFESVYTSAERLIMQDAYEAVLKIYRAHGLKSSAEDVYPDHIGLELEFMGFLCRKADEALEAGDEAAASKYFDEQKEFLEKHLLNWTEEFTADIAHWSETPFYQAAGKITRGFMELERAYFAEA